MSKSNVLKKSTDSYEEGKLLAWSNATFEQLELMMQVKACQIFSTFTYTKMKIKISTIDGTKLD